MALVDDNEDTTGKKTGNTNGSIILNNNNNNNNNYNNSNNLNNNLNNASSNSTDRNFRYPYYQKVGFSGVDEKKSLELILKENPIDKTRLIQFATRFTPPSVHREKVWLSLLNVINSLKQNHILNEQLRSALHLERASIILLDGRTNEEKKLVLMYLLDLGKLDINSAPQCLESEETRPLLNIASVITKADPQFKYEYTIFREIVKLIASINVDEIVSQISYDLANGSNATNGHHTHQNSQFTDSTQSIDANQHFSLPLKQMLESCFANYIPQTCVIKVWDRLFTGNTSKFMKMMALELLNAHQEKVNPSQDIRQILKELSPHKSEKALLKVCQIES